VSFASLLGFGRDPRNFWAKVLLFFFLSGLLSPSSAFWRPEVSGLANFISVGLQSSSASSFLLCFASSFLRLFEAWRVDKFIDFLGRGAGSVSLGFYSVGLFDEVVGLEMAGSESESSLP